MSTPPTPTRPVRTPHPHKRRTRFVCISDTHNCNVKLPKGDVLIHCGDLTNQGSFTELSKQIEWLEKADFELKIIVAGNHDLTLDHHFFADVGRRFHNNVTQDPVACEALIMEARTLTYLRHESRTFRLTSSSGPRTTFSVFGSPYSPAWGTWAFQYPRDDGGAAAKMLWDQIPLNTDILITHGPAHTHCDEARTREAAGCEVLRQALWRVRPRLALCGHIHEARGVERVTWDLDSRNAQYAELGRTSWEDKHKDSEKIALVDLTAKGGAPLDNDGSLCVVEEDLPEKKQSLPSDDPMYISTDDTRTTEDDDVAHPGNGTHGLGGNANSARCDQAAVAGRLGRRETCVINCAIQASSYTGSRMGVSRRLNKPIVVDIDLPTWENEKKDNVAFARTWN